CGRTKGICNSGGSSRRRGRGSPMRRTGSPLAIIRSIHVVSALLAAAPALAPPPPPPPVVTQEVDRTEVGTDDIFVLTVRATDVPSGSSLQLPDTPPVE